MSWSHVVVGALSHASGFALALLLDVVKRRLSARLAMLTAGAAGASWAAAYPPALPDLLLARLEAELRNRLPAYEVGCAMHDDPDRGRRMVLTVEPRA